MGSVSYDIHASSYCYKSHIQALFMVMALESLYSRTESPLQSIMILKRLNFDISAKVGVYITKKQSHDFFSNTPCKQNKQRYRFLEPSQILKIIIQSSLGKISQHIYESPSTHPRSFKK